MVIDYSQTINRFTALDAKSVVAVTEIDIFGYRISQGSISPDPERLRPLIEIPIPKSSKELKRCHGMFAYYARWIRNFLGKNKTSDRRKNAFSPPE